MNRSVSWSAYKKFVGLVRKLVGIIAMTRMIPNPQRTLAMYNNLLSLRNLRLNPQLVRDHRDKLRIRRFRLADVDGVAEQ